MKVAHIECPHCGGRINVRYASVDDLPPKTEKEKAREAARRPSSVFDEIFGHDGLFDKIFGRH